MCFKLIMTVCERWTSLNKEPAVVYATNVVNAITGTSNIPLLYRYIYK